VKKAIKWALRIIQFSVSNRYPLCMYAFDLDLNGIPDLIATGFWEDREGVMQEYTLNYLDELVGQSHCFMKRFPVSPFPPDPHIT